MNFHIIAEWQIAQKLRSDEEILALVGLACDIDEHLEDFSLVFRIHALIDFVNTSERNASHVLKAESVNGYGNSSLSSRLNETSESSKFLVIPVLDTNGDTVVCIVALRK